MKLSEAWLREWANPSVSTGELCERLTLAGHELESVEPAAPPFSGVVVGAVLDVQPHPNADKLRVCRVDDGHGRELEIVCGAPNVHAGMRAPLALDGAALPGGLKIRRSKLRGVTSEGMLCSARELGLGDDAGGIIEFPADAEIGRDLREYLTLDDRVIDLAITANRGDCLSVAGIAREVSALYAIPLRVPEWPAATPAHDESFPIRLEEPTACPAYAGRIVRNVRLDAQTPFWMRERLRRAGLRPLQPVVDVTNYVMLELGQPLHAFDFDKLQGSIIVRHARSGERLMLLDGREIALTPDLLVIADQTGPTALAGIMGGLASAVSAETRNIFLEAAYFAPTTIAGRARSLGMQTDASYRFERGVDPMLNLRAIERATVLLQEIVGGDAGPISLGLVEEELPARPLVWLRRARLALLLGTEVPDEQVTTILSGLELPYIEKADGWLVTPPSFRFDLAREEDLIEEVARVYGYARIPERIEHAALLPKPEPEDRVALGRVRAALVDRGYFEAITYSFGEPALQAMFAPEAKPQRLINPISSELAVMRVSLWPGLIGAVRQNASRQQQRVRLFEIGSKYLKQGTERVEEQVIAGVGLGTALPEQWSGASKASDFYDLKADVVAVLHLTGAPESFTFEAASHPALHPGQSARILRDGRDAGWLGALHPRIVRELDLPGMAYVFELRAQAVLAGRAPTFHAVSPYPAVRRDLAMIVDEAVSAEQLLCTARSAAPPYLRDIRLFDVYRGKGVESGRKSMALGLIFQESSRTLTDADADEAVRSVKSRLEQTFNARIRD
jgi:phenylalanyl-tRNA synthetase beta chain